MLLKLLQLKFGSLDARQDQLVREADTAQLELYTERILAAVSIDEVFEGI